MNIRAISKYIGIALIFDAMFMFVSTIVSVLNGFDSSFSPLFLSATLTFTVGIFPLIFVKDEKFTINISEGLVIIVFAWILSCLFGMMPYVLWGGGITILNAWFESVSGFTTTGCTILSDIEMLPKGLLFWRSSTHYIGGLGVVIFMMMIIPNLGNVRARLGKIEVSDLSKSNYNYKSKQLTKVVGAVYVGLTVILIPLLMLAGMNFFDAVNHSFSTIATGGFSTKNASIGYYDSVIIEVIISIFMVLSSLHFGLIFTSIANRNNKIFKDQIVRYYIVSLAVSAVLVTIGLILSSDYDSLWGAFRDATFAVVSLGTSTGFATVDTSVWPLFSILVLVYMMIQCGCSGSTSGGIKADRVWILYKSIKAQLLRTLHPNAVVSVKYGETVADRDLLTSITTYVILYVVLVFLFGLAYSAIGLDLPDSLSASISMLSNVGPGFGSIGSLENFAHIPALGRFLMSFEMIFGRLGIYSLLIFYVLANVRRS